MKIADILSAVRKTWIFRYLTKVYACYHCKKHVRGLDREIQCEKCGKLSCIDCILRCAGCKKGLCLDCYIRCRSCYGTFCTDCLLECGYCERHICLSCSQKCGSCDERFCANCIIETYKKFPYLCPGVIITVEKLCRTCFSLLYGEIENKYLNAVQRETLIETWPDALKTEAPPVETLRELSTPLFEQKEDSLKALRITAAFLNSDLVCNVKYIKHYAYSGYDSYWMWQAKGTAARKREE